MRHTLDYLLGISIEAVKCFIFHCCFPKDLMPGHVHTLGILRHSRSRHERDEPPRDLEDDCLGDAEPLINPTGMAYLGLIKIHCRGTSRLGDGGRY